MMELLKLREGVKIQKKYQGPLNEFVNVALEKYGEKNDGVVLYERMGEAFGKSANQT